MNLQTELTVIHNAAALLFVYYTSKRADSILKTPKEYHHKAHCAIYAVKSHNTIKSLFKRAYRSRVKSPLLKDHAP